ncbi:putative peroxisome assembly protein 12 [Lucilia cuprina]|uniref:Peroxisome assembly protein 12 n=1 Tax=Lucilia cuprina TaxID=7375 RepID=A0A0L0CB69_LUCCU|nr:Peroxisome assembly protein 12 [Lucilia cuprina]KNC28714.1 putative peroxisome assembly protein 12 [Lucilia cuprina]
MAEAANVRQNLQNVPSIFEISAAETLDNLIYPALSKIFDYFGLRLDFTLWPTKRIKEELSPLFTWFLQYLYLSKRGSSFGESFYGLQRTDTLSGNLLSKQQEIISASILTLMPYIERKLKTRAQHEDISKWEEYLLNLFHAYKASKAVHTFMYLIKYASSHSPIFRALKLTLRYPNEPPKEDKTTYVFLKLLEVLAFFLQFIQWWYSNEQRRKVGGTLENPEPITVTEDSLKKCNTPAGDCPVCLMKIENPTACSVSGYVYCWKCIALRLKEHSSTCPVTGYAITIEDLIRIYES